MSDDTPTSYESAASGTPSLDTEHPYTARRVREQERQRRRQLAELDRLTAPPVTPRQRALARVRAEREQRR